MRQGPGLLEIATVQRLAHAGTKRSSEALSNLCRREITMTAPTARTIGVADIPDMLGKNAESVAIMMGLQGELTGNIAFILSITDADRLSHNILNRTLSGDGVEDLLARSMLLEMGNIINSSFVSALADATNCDVRVTPPRLTKAKPGALTDDIFARAAFTGGVALAFGTEMLDENDPLLGTFIFIPSFKTLDRVFHALGIQEVA